MATDSGRVYRRSVSGGAWALDTALPVGSAYLQWFWTGRNGSVFGATYPGDIYVRQSGSWARLGRPTITTGLGSHPRSMSVDSSGAVFAAYDILYANLMGGGIWMTTNSGASWTKLGLDSLFVNSLVSVGDTTYAATERGIYAMTRTGLVLSPIRSVVESRPGWALDPIRANGSMVTANFQLAQRGKISLKIYDIRGQTVATFFSGVMDAGSHSLSQDMSRIPRGIYFCRLQAKGFSKTRKFTAQR